MQSLREKSARLSWQNTTKMRIVATHKFIRVTVGGGDKDFPMEEEEQARNYIMEMMKKWKYVTIRVMYNFQRIEE